MTELIATKGRPDFQKASELLDSVLHVTRELLPALAEACRQKMREHPEYIEGAHHQTIGASTLAYQTILCDTTITVDYLRSLTPEEALEFARRVVINVSRRITTAYSNPGPSHV